MSKDKGLGRAWSAAGATQTRPSQDLYLLALKIS